MDEPPLTESELKELRDLLEADRRAKWLMSKIKAIALWAAAVIGGLTLTGETIIKVLKGLLK